ncbi:hypothetical protein GVN20_18470 [Runella sp. CRIBMP]|uniref:hypothetical protein n=1 Tax=Runella sp. CRIBMP TaxID=2683261 RepID=UPI001412252F|nr:hypothetical protein [Runella sp. CRIBMP]NBB21357.1 hypothetical protein [Runella sp. CRIBMP]
MANTTTLSKNMSIRRALICLLAVLFLATVGCKKQDRTTMVFGIITNDINQPIEKVPVEIHGNNGIIASSGDKLTTVYTNAKGEYSVTLDVPKGYHSVQVFAKWYSDTAFVNKYKNSTVTKNGRATRDCCRGELGQKTQYDFVLIPF